jgi:hypothetical protein
MSRKQIKWTVINPNPKTVGDLRFALSGYEDSLELVQPIAVYISGGDKKPYKMQLKHVKPMKKKKYVDMFDDPVTRYGNRT